MGKQVKSGQPVKQATIQNKKISSKQLDKEQPKKSWFSLKMLVAATLALLLGLGVGIHLGIEVGLNIQIHEKPIIVTESTTAKLDITPEIIEEYKLVQAKMGKIPAELNIPSCIYVIPYTYKLNS